MKKAVLGLVVAVAVLAGAMLLREGRGDTAPGPWSADAKGRQAPEVVLRISPPAGMVLASGQP